MGPIIGLTRALRIPDIEFALMRKNFLR